jgi:hypothetical protein
MLIYVVFCLAYYLHNLSPVYHPVREGAAPVAIPAWQIINIILTKQLTTTQLTNIKVYIWKEKTLVMFTLIQAYFILEEFLCE